ncbi:hypothetical protein CR513_07120, partial [Mucuna pruriens]
MNCSPWHCIGKKKHLCHHFQTKYHGRLQYIIGIKETQSKNDIMVSKDNGVYKALDSPTTTTSFCVWFFQDSYKDPNRIHFQSIIYKQVQNSGWKTELSQCYFPNISFASSFLALLVKNIRLHPKIY